MFTHRLDQGLELRILEERNAEELYMLTEANRPYLSRWLPWPDDILSIGDSRLFIRDGLRQFAENNGFQAGIWSDNELIGCIGFHRINWTDRNTEIGYWLAENMTGRGIMTKACTALLDYAFNVWKLHRVVIRCAVENVKSRAIPQRLGFTQEGILRGEIYVNDAYLDHVLYSVLSDEWWDFREQSMPK
jgi:ribosomal-protein-serine acetyltransferase